MTSLSASSLASVSLASGRSRTPNPFGLVDPNSYSDYDEAMQDGVELEEKGERFQFGPKAQRFYVQAGTLYDRAASLVGTNEERRADALYNASRIHFLLASQFALPPENLRLFVEATNAAQQAVRLAPPLSAARSQDGILPDPFTLDATTQLATSMQTMAEAVDELGWPQGLQPPRLPSHTAYGAPTPTSLWQEAASLFQQVADGQNVILQDQKVVDGTDAETAAPVTQTLKEEIPHNGELSSANGGGDVYGYTSSLVTPLSVMETGLSLLACYQSLVEASSTIEQVQTHSAAAQQLVTRAQSMVAEPEAAAALPATSNDAAQSASEVAAKWEELRCSSLAARVTCISKAFDLGSEPARISDELETLMQSVYEWGSQLVALPAADEAGSAKRQMSVATLCDLGEAGQILCRLSLRMQPTTAANAAIWMLATLSTKLFSQALAALDTSAAGGGAAAVLGQANTSTPTSRARCRILLALSNLSIFRSHPVFEGAGIAGAQGTRTKLVDNARLYARKAVTEIGLGSVLRPAPAQAPRSVRAPPPGGWESMALESEATFHLLRALLVRCNVHTAAAADRQTVAEMETELFNLAQHIIELRQRPIQTGATPSSGSVELAGWLYGQGAKSFVDDIADENGRDIMQDELVWWEKLFSEHLGMI